MSLDRYHAVSVRFSITVGENCLCINCICQAAMSDWLQVSLLFSSLGLLHVIFRTFLPELWPLIYAINLFPLNILRTNSQNFTKFNTLFNLVPSQNLVCALVYQTLFLTMAPITTVHRTRSQNLVCNSQ